MEPFSALLAFCAGKSPVSGEFPAQRSVTWSFDVFFDLRLNKRLSKQSWGWWSETLSCPLWRQCNVVETQLLHSHTQWFSNKSLVARAVWDGTLSWTRTKSFWKGAVTHARHTSVSCRLAQPTHVCHHDEIQLIRWHKDRHYHLLPVHRHQFASHPAAYAPAPELVQLCDATWNSSVKIHCRHPANTFRNNGVVITPKRRHFDVITSKWRRFDVITTLLLRHVFSGQWRMSHTRWRPAHWQRRRRCIEVTLG